MFRLDNQRVFRAKALESIPWLQHGFGTRTSLNWPEEARAAYVRQVHSDKVLFADHPGMVGEGDALITNQPGITLVIRTADCLPILIADARNKAVAAVHAGWRGTVLEILPKTIQAMAERFGSNESDLIIAVGPGIGGCCFEVGPEVARQFAPFFPERDDLDARTKIDLIETNIRQLRRNGGSVRQIDTSAQCSCCEADLYHSYRRDREKAGRMVSGIGLR